MLSCHRDGGRIRLKCDTCGRRTDSLTRVAGHWTDRATGLKVRRIVWLCPDCLRVVRNGR